MNDDMQHSTDNPPRSAGRRLSFLRLTSLARTIDPRLPSHRAALLVGLGSAVFAAAVNLDNAPLGFFFNAGVGSFLGWALAREIDPDRPKSAALSGAVTGITTALLGHSLLLPVVLVLVTARLLHRSTGLPPTLFDLLALIGVAYVGGTSMVGWACAMALAFATARDHRLPSPAPRVQLLAGFLMAAAASAGAVISGVSANWQLPDAGEMVFLGFGVIAGLSLRTYVPAALADYTRGPLEVRRLRSARRGVLGAGLLAFAVAGGAAVVALSPLWSALMGVAVWDRFGRDQVNHV